MTNRQKWITCFAVVLGMAVGIIASVGFCVYPRAGATADPTVTRIAGEPIPWIGIDIQNVDAATAEALNIRPGDGVLVTRVFEGSPADEAGIQPGDVIVRFDRQKATDLANMQEILSSLSVGDTVRVNIIRDGLRRSVFITIGARPGAVTLVAGSDSGPDTSTTAWGMVVSPLTSEDLSALDLPDVKGGVIVVQVYPGELAATAGILAGDVIVGVNSHRVKDIKTFYERLAKDDAVVLDIYRNGEERSVSVDAAGAVPPLARIAGTTDDSDGYQGKPPLIPPMGSAAAGVLPQNSSNRSLECICLSCGTRVLHPAGVSCADLTCPVCGQRMTSPNAGALSAGPATTPPMGQRTGGQPDTIPPMGQPTGGQPDTIPPMGQPTAGALQVAAPMGQPNVERPDSRPPPIGRPTGGQPDTIPPMGQPAGGQPDTIPPMGQPAGGQPDTIPPMGQPAGGQPDTIPPMGQPTGGQPDTIPPMGQPTGGQPDTIPPMGQPAGGQPDTIPPLGQPAGGQPDTIPPLGQPAGGQPDTIPPLGQPAGGQAAGTEPAGQPNVERPDSRPPPIGRPTGGQPDTIPPMGQPTGGQPATIPPMGQPSAGAPAAGTVQSAPALLTSECLCPMCGTRVYHPLGVPCSSLSCPACGSRLVNATPGQNTLSQQSAIPSSTFPGTAGECLCPMCGATVYHPLGVPCSSLSCPVCGSRLVNPVPGQNTLSLPSTVPSSTLPGTTGQGAANRVRNLPIPQAPSGTNNTILYPRLNLGQGFGAAPSLSDVTQMPQVPQTLSIAGGLGQGGGGSLAGPGGYCVCPNCGTTVEHEVGIPCTALQCPVCGSMMVRALNTPVAGAAGAAATVAVAIAGSSLDSDLAPFDTAPNYIFVDLSTGTAQIIPNPNAGDMANVGAQSAQFVVDRGADTVIANSFSDKALNTLTQLRTEALSSLFGSLHEVINSYFNMLRGSTFDSSPPSVSTQAPEEEEGKKYGLTKERASSKSKGETSL